MIKDDAGLATVSWTPLFSSLLDSSTWAGGTLVEKVVWVALLAKKNRKGFVDVSLPGLALLSGVSIDECAAAIKKFEAPDPYSRSKQNDGRRIEQCQNGGWLVLNHRTYQNRMMSEGRREYQREKQARYRERKAQGQAGFSTPPQP